MKRLLPALFLMLAVPASYAATTLNLKDADINTLIQTVSEVTGKNFIVDDKVKGKVTVISSKPMSADAVYETFLAVLSIKGFAAVPAGSGVIKIVQDVNAKADGGARIGDGKGLADDEVVTNVYAIENVSASQLVPILRPLVPQWGHLVAYPPSNMLIISDRASNVGRLEKLIQQIDRTGDRDIEMIHLVYSGAADVVRILTTLTQQDKQTDPAVKPATIIADERSNSVLIGGDKSERQKLIDIITRLDQPLTEDGSTQVVYLNYASADKLAPILEGYAQQADSAGGAKPGGAAPAAAAGGGMGFEKTRILADKDTNSLIITGSPKSMKAVRNVIAQLDIRRSQVLVEAMVAEVSSNTANQLGLDWAVFNPEKIALAGILDPSTIAAAATLAAGQTAVATATATGNSPLSSLQGIVGGAGKIVDDGRSGTSFAILLKALTGDGDTNVLSTPTLVATDNEESKLTVGQELSIPTGSYATTGNTVGNPFVTNSQKTVGLILGLTPQINEGNSVKMKLSLEVSSQAAGAAGTASAVFNKRNIDTVVTVDSGQVLVLGGLIDDQTTDSVTAVPLLSKLPLLGGLFQSRSTGKIKRNLMVFIRPLILKTDKEADYYTRRKYDSVRQAEIDQINKPRSSLLPRPNSAVVPNFDTLSKDKPAAAPAPAEAAPKPQQ